MIPGILGPLSMWNLQLSIEKIWLHLVRAVRDILPGQSSTTQNALIRLHWWEDEEDLEFSHILIMEPS